MKKFSKFRIFSLASIAISIIFALITFKFIPFAGGDNFAYFSLSRAIATGKGYVELWTPNLPLHTLYPPLFPILLLPAAFFSSYTFAKIIVFLCYVLSLIFIYKLYVKLNGKRSEIIILISLLLFGFSPVVLEYSSWVLSEIPYILFSILSLYFWSRKKYNVSLFFAIIVFFTRTAGISLVISVSIFYFLKFKKEKKKVAILIFSLLSVLLWYVYTNIFRNPYQTSYFTSLLFKNPYNPNLGKIGLVDLVLRVIENIRLMILKVFSQMFWGKENIGIIGIVFACFLILGISIDKTFLKTINLVNLYLLLYFLIVWIWPSVWSADKRFYLPVLPIICFLIGRGIWRTSKWLKNPLQITVFSLVIPAIFVFHTFFLYLLKMPELWRNNIRWIKYKIPSMEALYFKHYIEIGKWAKKKQISKEAIFMVRKRRAFYYFTHFFTVPVPKPGDLSYLRRTIENNRVNYIVISSFFYSSSILINMMKALRDEYDFVPVYITSDKRAAVFEVRKK